MTPAQAIESARNLAKDTRNRYVGYVLLPSGNVPTFHLFLGPKDAAAWCRDLVAFWANVFRDGARPKVVKLAV